MAKCPECNARLTITPSVEIWDHIFCDACNVELEVVDKDPLELEAVYDFEEDEDVLDDFDDDEALESWDLEDDAFEDDDEDDW